MHTVRTKYKTLARAIRLRAQMTEAEKKLWRHLRGRQLDSRQFCKQVEIGDYVVDFCCLKARLVIEVDEANMMRERRKMKPERSG